MNERLLNPLSLSGDVLKLWLLICAEGEGSIVEASRERLAALVGKSSATVRRWLVELEAAGFISRTSSETIRLHARCSLVIEGAEPARVDDHGAKGQSSVSAEGDENDTPRISENQALEDLRRELREHRESTLRELDRISARVRTLEAGASAATAPAKARPKSPPLPFDSEPSDPVPQSSGRRRGVTKSKARAEAGDDLAAVQLPPDWREVIARAASKPSSGKLLEVGGLYGEQVKLDRAAFRVALEQGHAEGWVFASRSTVGEDAADELLDVAPLIDGAQRDTVRVDVAKARAMKPHAMLAAWRSRMGLSYRAAAKVIGMSSHIYTRTEKGERSPSDEERMLLERLAFVPATAWGE